MANFFAQMETNNNNQDYGHDHKYPTFHGLMELPDHHQLLQSSSSNQLASPSLFSNQFNSTAFSHENGSIFSMSSSTTHVPNSLYTSGFENNNISSHVTTSTNPHMSATALLQKAAQIGSTSSNNNQFGGGGGNIFLENDQNNNNFQDLMNSVLSDDGINSSSIFGHVMVDEEDGPKVNIGNSDGMTRDFLGVGHIVRNMNGSAGSGIGGGFSQQQHGVGTVMSSLNSDTNTAASSQSFGEGTFGCED